MRVLFDINHPAHVHVFRETIWTLRERGHSVLVASSEKEVATQLLREYRIPFVSLGHPGGSVAAKGVRLATSIARLLPIATRFSPDVLVGISPIRAAPIAWVLRRPCIGLDDTEHAALTHRIYMPFVTRLLTPQCYGLDVGKKQVRYQGYHELAYLHPRYFKPDPSVLASEGLSVDAPFSFVRFVSWRAAHDVGQGGFSGEGKVRLVGELARHGRVLVSGEAALSDELSHYAFKAPPHLIHHFLHYAKVCVAEGATIASEAAVSGTPAIYMNTLGLGYLADQQKRYGLVFNFHDRQNEQAAIDTAVGIMQQSESEREGWRLKAARLVEDSIDVTEFIIETVLGAGR